MLKLAPSRNIFFKYRHIIAKTIISYLIGLSINKFEIHYVLIKTISKNSMMTKIYQSNQQPFFVPNIIIYNYLNIYLVFFSRKSPFPIHNYFWLTSLTPYFNALIISLSDQIVFTYIYL
jgi:hypothetical protein